MISRPTWPTCGITTGRTSARRRADQLLRISLRVEETYYRPLGQSFAKHGVALAGHPGESMDIGVDAISNFPDRTWCGVWSCRAQRPWRGPTHDGQVCFQSPPIILAARAGNELYGAYGTI